MTEQWRELKETIIELRDNDGTGTQQEVCKFLANYMDVLEKQMSDSENPNKGEWIAQDIHNCHTNFKCSKCGYIHDFMHLYGEPTADYTYCPNCGADMREPKGEKIRCNTCVNSDDELSGECYECVKGIFDHYETEVENGRTND